LFLTALTGLTQLELNDVSLQQKSDGLGGEVAFTALAQSLTQLRQLSLQDCEIDLSSMEVLTAIGQLRQLTAGSQQQGNGAGLDAADRVDQAAAAAFGLLW
jgi:hypothetical protein